MFAFYCFGFYFFIFFYFLLFYFLFFFFFFFSSRRRHTRCSRDWSSDVCSSDLLHFLIALGTATVYYLASRRFEILVHRAVLFGLIYGAFVYAFMHVIEIGRASCRERV